MYFLYPSVLFFMLIPIFFLFFLTWTNKSKFEKVFEKESLDKLAISNKHFTKKTRNFLLFLALFFMTIALSRPVIDNKNNNITQQITPIVFAIDISRSMLANDLYPNRLKFAKQKIIEAINLNNNLAIGVIIFAKYSYIVSPLTNDFSSLKYLIENFDNNLNINDGSNILGALEASNKLLKDYPSKNLILLSDGGNKESYEEEINYANEQNIKVYSIGIATLKPTPIPTKNGYLKDENDNIVTVSLNETIKKLSIDTNAAFTNYSIDTKDIKAIIYDILSSSKQVKSRSKQIKMYTELFYYPLGLAIFVLLIAFSSLPKSKTSIFLILLTFSSYDLKASILDFQELEEAKKAYDESKYSKSSDIYKNFINKNEGKYNFANSLYKEKKYESALKSYKNIETSDDNLEFKKLHNMGNTYVKLNKLEDAKKMYEKALKIKEDTQTKENLKLVNNALNKNKENKESKNNNSKKENKENKNQNKKENNNQKEEESKASNQNDKNITKKENPLISNKEEEKWLKILENKKSPVMLKKVETKNTNTQTNTSPW